MDVAKIIQDVVDAYSEIPEVHHISFIPRTDIFRFIIYYISDHYDPDKFGILLDQEIFIMDKYPDLIFDMSHISSDGRDVVEDDGSVEIYPKDGIGDGYCLACGSCGIDDCCSAIECLKKHMKTSGDCFHGDEYVKDIEFYYRLGKDLYNLIAEQEESDLWFEANRTYDRLYDQIYLTKKS